MHPETKTVMCGLKSAYCQRGTVSAEFFEATKKYCHRLQWVDDFAEVDDEILKFTPTVPAEKTAYYTELFQEQLNGALVPTSSGNGEIDLIIPDCHKASGLERLVQHWGITPEQCVAFGDGNNDIEMLEAVGWGLAMANASTELKAVADEVIGHVADDGVSQFCVDHGLIERL